MNKDLDILNEVNDFYNRKINWISDEVLWDEKDYWATPLETVMNGAGDCEDFAILKFFSLLDKGISRMHLRLMYAKIKDTPHMVVCYVKGDEHLVLDNIDQQIIELKYRDDLTPVYSFNLNGVWVVTKTKSEHIGRPNNLTLWKNLLDKMRIDI